MHCTASHPGSRYLAKLFHRVVPAPHHTGGEKVWDVVVSGMAVGATSHGTAEIASNKLDENC